MSHTLKLMLFVAFFTAANAAAFQFHAIKKVANSVGANLNYNYLNYFDFNEDGTPDRVSCNLNHFIRIKDGKTNKDLYSWAGPEKFRDFKNGWTHRKVLSGCEIVVMPNGRPIVLISNYWDTFLNNRPYWRARSYQWVIYHNGKKFVHAPIKMDNNTIYSGVSRSVKCDKYPQKLVNQGYRPGALCFFADYASDNYNRTALFKLEQSTDMKTIVAKDLTASSIGAPWSGGALGTNIYTMGVGAGWASNQRDGAFMMDSAFVDINKDKLPDLVTIGQHAKLRSHKMIIDHTKREGIRYETTALTQARKGIDMTEFIKVTAVDKRLPRIDLPCVYISLENEGIGRDHIRCFHSNRWVVYDLPQKFNSSYKNARIKYDSKLGLVIKTGFVNNQNKLVELTFRVPDGKVVVPPAPVVAPVAPTCPHTHTWNGFFCVERGFGR